MGALDGLELLNWQGRSLDVEDRSSHRMVTYQGLASARICPLARPGPTSTTGSTRHQNGVL